MSTKKHSKRLSYILRHAPEEVGLTLAEGGWVSINDLLGGLATKNWVLSREELEHIVATNDKKRFTISGDGHRIRAAQGHSVDVRHDLVTVTPPETLYHGTATRFWEAINLEGLRPMCRQHVHLSADRQTATKVGQRHGKPIILIIEAGKMASAGLIFYQADNGVWLTDVVAREFIRLN